MYRVHPLVPSIELKAKWRFFPFFCLFCQEGWRVRMKGRWPRAIVVTRANHDVDNDRIEVHANLAGMGDFNCRAGIDLSPRGGDLSCARTTFRLLFFYLASSFSSYLSLQSPKRRVSAFSRYGNTYRYYATSLAEPPKSNMKSSAWAKFSVALLCHFERSTFIRPHTVVLSLFHSIELENCRQAE